MNNKLRYIQNSPLMFPILKNYTMQRKILLLELLIQATILISCFLSFFLKIVGSGNYFEIIYVMIILAVANIVGFFIRIFTYQSRLMAYYFFAVIAYMLSLFILSLLGNVINNAIFNIYFYGGSLLLSFYYTISGFFILKEINKNS